MVAVDMPSFDVTTDNLIVDVEIGNAGQWMMMTEVRFSAVPEPVSGILVGVFAIGLVCRRTRVLHC